MTNDELARASMDMSEDDWTTLLVSADFLDRMTVVNARATADNIIRAFPAISSVTRQVTEEDYRRAFSEELNRG